MKPQHINLQSEILDEFRMNFDIAINMIVRQLKERRLTNGTLTAKIDIELKEETTQDGEVIHKMKVSPDINVKIGAKGKLECKEKGGIFMKIDKDGQPLIASNQISMDELMDEKKRA